MKYIFLNFRSFILREKIIFFVIIVCVLASSFILNFAYGLYKNYDTQKYEDEVELKDIDPKVLRSFTKKELQDFSESLSVDALNGLTIIYAAGELEEFPIESGENTCMPTRFVIKNGVYNICEETRKNWEENGMISSGRYITNEEEAMGADVALVPSDGADGYSPQAKSLISDDGETIKLFGKDYKIIGSYKAGTSTPIVPFLSIPDDFEYTQFGLMFESNITRAQYEEITEKAETYIPGAFSFEELQFPDRDSIYLYNNIILISVVIAVAAIVNFAMLYLFMLKKRSRQIAIMELCGCSSFNLWKYSLGECLLLSIPAYLVGTGLYVILLNNVFSDIFNYIKDAYTFKIYVILFLVYFISMIIIISSVVIYNLKKNMKTRLSGGSI